MKAVELERREELVVFGGGVVMGVFLWFENSCPQLNQKSFFK
jgi:hypothetical protein